MIKVLERAFALALVVGATACASPPAPPPAPPQQPAALARAAMTEDAVNRGVVAVRATGQDDNYRTPWAKKPPWTRSASGIVVDGHRVLVGGRMLDHASFIEIQRYDGVRVAARVVLHDAEALLTLLTTDDASFWAPLAPLPLLPVVIQGGRVGVVRRPNDGAMQAAIGNVRSVTGAVLGPGWGSCLAMEMDEGFKDAGPSEIVLGREGVAGILTLHLEKSSIVTSSAAIRDFLAEAGHAPYRGFADTGVATHAIRDPALRDHLGLAATEGGIRVERVLPQGSAAGSLEVGDVILDVAGLPIDATGHLAHPVHGKVWFSTIFTLDGRRPGNTVELTILRGGQRRKVSITLKRVRTEDEKVPLLFQDEAPEYTVQGGLVFEALSAAYLWTWGTTWEQAAPPRLLVALTLERDAPTPGKKRVIILSHVLPDPANLGYEKTRDLIVSAINGVAVQTIDDVRSAFLHPAGGFDVVELQAGQYVRRIVLDAAEVEAARKRLTDTYGPALSGR